jgi:hypothetical protein
MVENYAMWMTDLVRPGAVTCRQPKFNQEEVGIIHTP